MKYFYTALFALLTYGGFAQEIEDIDKKFDFAVVEKVPVLRGCEDMKDQSNEALRTCFQQGVIRHVAKNFKFPEEARKKSMGAKIFVAFIIEKDGSISGVEVLKGATDTYRNSSAKKFRIAKEIDEEAMRVVRSIEISKPAIQRGKPVRMSFVLPINAKIQ
jgi:protein TonB